MPKLLSDSEVKTRLARLPKWRKNGPFIARTFEFEDFMGGIRFLNRVAEVAEKEEHHPDIHVRYTEVKLAIQTHSEGGLTARDFALATEIDKIAP